MPDDGDMAVEPDAASNKGPLRSRVRSRLRRTASLSDLQEEQVRLAERVARLEADLNQERRLQRRVAELVDVVQQVLLPASDVDEAELRRRLEAYAKDV